MGTLSIERKLVLTIEKKIIKVFNKYFREQRKIVMDYINSHIVEVQKADSDYLNLNINELIDKLKRTQGNERIINNLESLLAKITTDTAKMSLKEILGSFDNVDVFRLVNTEAVDYARERAGTLITGIDETTLEVIREKLIEAIEEGLSAQELADLIDENGLFGEVRSLMIARTESSDAHNQGSLIAARESGVVDGKSWLLASDACEICEGIVDNTPNPIPLDDNFFDADGEEYDAPPAHPNCRCTMTFETTTPEEPTLEFEETLELAESSELQKAETYKPTEAMAKEAKRALKWKAEGKAGGTRVGLARANQLVKRENLSESTVKRMFSFFSRHEVDKQGKGFSPDEEGYPSKGRVAWALWGGDAGFSWSRRIVESLKKKG